MIIRSANLTISINVSSLYLADLSVQLVYMLAQELTKPQDNQLEY